MSIRHIRILGQLNKHSSASHFRPPKSRFWPSESVRAKSDSTVHLRRPISTLPSRFATIRDRRRVDRRVTCGQTEVGVPERIVVQAPMPGFARGTTHARCFSFPLHSAAVDTHVCHRANTTRKWRRDMSPL